MVPVGYRYENWTGNLVTLSVVGSLLLLLLTGTCIVFICTVLFFNLNTNIDSLK